MPRMIRSLALSLGVVAVLAAVPSLAQEDEAAAEDGDVDTFYSLGVMVSQQLGNLNLAEDEVEKVISGLRDGLAGKAEVDPRQVMPKIQALTQERAKQAAGAERGEAEKFLAEMASEAKAAGGQVTESGLIYTELVAGEGASPAATDRVQVHYHGTLRTGKVFDSSVDRGEPVTFGLDQVIPCWTEGVQKLKVGGKAKLVCPPDLAYGDRAAGPIPPGSALVFEVELLSIES